MKSGAFAAASFMYWWRSVCAQLASELHPEVVPAAPAKYDLKCSRVRCTSPWVVILPMRSEKSGITPLGMPPGDSKRHAPLKFSIALLSHARASWHRRS